MEQAIFDSFVANDVTLLVSSAACGADLLAIKAAQKKQIRFRIVLPFRKDLFRKTSVVDRPGNWGPLFDNVISVAEVRQDVLVNEHASADQAYQQTNRIIFTEGQRLGSSTLRKGCIAYAVWDGHMREGEDLTWQFLEIARSQDVPEITILTLENLGN